MTEPTVEEVAAIEVPKVAAEGTLMFRRSDALGAISKHLAKAATARDLAWREGREADAMVHSVRYRALQGVRDEVILKLPVFVNAAATEARKRESAHLNGEGERG